MAKVPNQRDIIDRKTLVSDLALLVDDFAPTSMEFRNAVLKKLKQALASGQDEIKRRFMENNKGRPSMHAASFLMDQIIRVIYDVATEYIYPLSNPTPSEKLSLLAVGGYGRGELAPHSDVDLLFLFPYKQTAWSEQVVEFTLYMLWDLGLKVGHATRTTDECIRLSRQDITIQTALLEARYLWGDKELATELRNKFMKEIVAGNGKQFIEAKLHERDERHKKYGNSRYVVEPNLKEGKGGLRDLQTLFWLAKFLYSTTEVSELERRGVFTRSERQRLTKASNFLRTVRCHLHYLTNRPEERLTFDVQGELAARLGYTDHAGTLGVERFMKHYFLIAKDIGDLTRIFCANLEAMHQKKSRLSLPRIGLLKRKVDGFRAEGGRLDFLSEEDIFSDPVKILGLFHVAQNRGLDVHPNALRLIRRNLKLINRKLRQNEEANRLFMEMLTSRKDPETTLRRLNEAGVFGKFIPDFGRVVAQMQHDMYHVYTVDEHTIRAIGILSHIEDGLLSEEHPLSHRIMPKIVSRRVLYTAVLLHDIAKGRGGDHSVLGADVAKRLCPRLGLTASETETVAWLVRYHLLFSNFAFKRDISDPKTVADFVQIIQSPVRLKLLLILTVVDIRAVGPNVWNGWKGQLLRDLYYASETALTGGHISDGRTKRADYNKGRLAETLTDWSDEERDAHLARFYESYWVSNSLEIHKHHAELMRAADRTDDTLTIEAVSDQFQSVTEVTVYTPDHPGLFARIAAAMSLSGASIVDAKIHTTVDGMALDSFVIQDMEGNVFDQGDRMKRLRATIEDTLKGKRKAHIELTTREHSSLPSRTRVFKVEPAVMIDNKASNIHTVIEVHGRDRVGLLAELTRALFTLSLSISSAHIATYGERAVDVFYVKDMFGLKITNDVKLRSIEEKLIEVLSEPEKPRKKSAKSKKSQVEKTQ
ncbi:[protein-PII] uridylyltransferase [Sneathiella chinensis]|uniref:Bifunctional uridylyltransferase/uridylyl-removing enzyme n=1 Tax=Sneathiella chinensis TaxID=349750 RepID=A0ABQ5U0N8_9PROT|nr:[protein-PII] uridylyltransferase [Sneathiella chinensis]GLQ05221.1 bifunctional uridylyltransferase/uridylyl-removing enzyme [Sneathiella chinensis]